MLGTLLAIMLVAPSAESLLANVAATYKRGGDFSATFTQTYTDKLRGRSRVESGHLWVKADGRVRWSYEKPDVKDFVFDGKQAFFYEPENAQVTIFDKFEESPLWSALRFLWGRGSPGGRFDVALCKTHCEVGVAGDHVLELTPRDNMAAVERALLAIDPASQRVRGARVLDPLGNRTDYAFSEFRFGLKLEAQRFVFEVPDGVSILRPAAETPPTAAPTK